MESHNHFGYNGVALSLDNWSSHCSQKVKEFLQNCGWNVLYLPSYSPQLAQLSSPLIKLKELFDEKAKRERVQAK